MGLGELSSEGTLFVTFNIYKFTFHFKVIPDFMLVL